MNQQPSGSNNLEERLRRTLRSVPLSAQTRNRHLNRIRTYGPREIEHMGRPRWLELGLISTVLIVVLAIAAWQFGPFGEDDNQPTFGASTTETALPGILTEDSTQDAKSMPTPPIPVGDEVYDAVATATAMGCQMTPYSEDVPSRLVTYDGYQHWIEQDGIWVSPPAFFAGNWHVGGGGMDTAWFSSFEGELSATARNLDDPSMTFELKTEDAQHSFVVDSAVIVATTDFPSPGCWEITAAFGEHEANIIVNVLPFEERRDYLFYHYFIDVVTPYAPPANCQVTPLIGPEFRDGPNLDFWIDGDGLSLPNHYGVYWEGENEFDFTPVDDSELIIDGRLRTGPDQPYDLRLTYDIVERVGWSTTYWSVLAQLPAPGCWDIHAEAGDRTLDLTIYVYPAECRPDLDTVGSHILAGEPYTLPEGCEPPEGQSTSISPSLPHPTRLRSGAIDDHGYAMDVN